MQCTAMYYLYYVYNRTGTIYYPVKADALFVNVDICCTKCVDPMLVAQSLLFQHNNEHCAKHFILHYRPAIIFRYSSPTMSNSAKCAMRVSNAEDITPSTSILTSGSAFAVYPSLPTTHAAFFRLHQPLKTLPAGVCPLKARHVT